MYRIAVVEDEEMYRKQISDYIRQYEQEQDILFDVRQFQNGQEFIQASGEPFDIIFLDIEMPEINGMEAARHIRRRDEDVIIVFITNMAQYAIQGYSVGALDFVLKPVNFYAFSLRLTRALRRVKHKRGTQIVLNSSSGRVSVSTNAIYYLESEGRRLHYYTKEGNYTVQGTMQEAESILREYHFAKCNHWYLVNLKHVSGIKGNIAQVADTRLEISRRNKAAFIKALTDYVGEGL